MVDNLKMSRLFVFLALFVALFACALAEEASNQQQQGSGTAAVEAEGLGDNTHIRERRWPMWGMGYGMGMYRPWGMGYGMYGMNPMMGMMGWGR